MTFPEFDFFDVENIVDEPHQPLAIGIGNREQPRRGRRQLAAGAADQQAERARDRGQRRAQFVTDGGDEVVLETFVAFALADVAHEHDEHAAPPDGHFAEYAFDRKRRSIAAVSHEFAGLAILRHELAELRAGADTIGAAQVDEAADIMAHQSLAGAAENAFGLRIEAFDGAAFVQRQNSDQGRGKHGFLPRQRIAERPHRGRPYFNLLTKRTGLFPHLFGHAFETAREHADFADRVHRHGHPFVAAEASTAALICSIGCASERASSGARTIAPRTATTPAMSVLKTESAPAVTSTSTIMATVRRVVSVIDPPTCACTGFGGTTAQY